MNEAGIFGYLLQVSMIVDVGEEKVRTNVIGILVLIDGGSEIAKEKIKGDGVRNGE